MRNSVLPFVSPHYEFGSINNYELQMLNENLHNMNSSTPGFDMEANKMLDNENKEQTSVENYSLIPSIQSSLVTYQPAAFPSSVLSSCDLDNLISHQHSLLLGKKILSSQLDLDFQAIRNARKRPIEVNNDILAKSGISELVGDRAMLNYEFGKNKRSKVMTENKQVTMRETLTAMHEYNKVQVIPVKRSQKLTEKITALQKLVSPYGKTDTASVLQEASLYIKLLQDQIQNLFRMLSSSYDNSVRSLLHSQDAGMRRLDLRSKGLCLVPISFIQKVTMEERNDHKYRRY